MIWNQDIIQIKTQKSSFLLMFPVFQFAHYLQI